MPGDSQELKASSASASSASASAGGGTFGGSRNQLLNLVGELKLKLQKVPGFGGSKLPITQFVICGSQSAGKSRLVETLAGAAFNFVSGTLGSRRPTVIEFRNDPQKGVPTWYVMDTEAIGGNGTNDWREVPLAKLQTMVARAHEMLGHSVS